MPKLMGIINFKFKNEGKKDMAYLKETKRKNLKFHIRLRLFGTAIPKAIEKLDWKIQETDESYTSS